jgi:hypothetical protein
MRHLHIFVFIVFLQESIKFYNHFVSGIQDIKKQCSKLTLDFYLFIKQRI